MVTFPKYEKYIESGTVFGKLPACWHTVRLGYISAVIDPQPDHRAPAIAKEGGFPYIGIRDVNNDGSLCLETARQVVEEAVLKQERSFWIEPKDILFGKVGTLGQPKHIKPHGRFAISATLVLIKGKNNTNRDFLKYALDSHVVYEQIENLSNGATRPALGIQQIRKLLLAVPPIEEQKKIAKFLDRKTSEIDQAIAQKQRLIELLQEQKAILINQAVTKGLDPNVPMCDRGVEWLGDIPAHWTISKLKFLLKSIDYGLSESALSEGDYKYLNMGHIQNKKVLVENTGYLNSITENLLLKTNDILFNRTNSFDLVGKSGIFKGTKTDKVTFASYLVRLRSIKSVVPDWLNYLLNDVSFLSYIRSLALRSLNQANLNPNRLSAVQVPVPPTEEQIKIAEFIFTIERETNKQIATAQKTIELYEELKKTYISEAITGKIKV